MCKRPYWLTEMETCDVCHDVAIEDKIEVVDSPEPQVQIYYKCDCGNYFGFAHTGGRYHAYKAYLKEMNE